MKVILLHMALVIFLPSAFCQNSVQSKTSPSKYSEQERWNLDKYVWSHTRYKTTSKDKPVLDFDAIENWIGVGDDADLSISPNGQYFAYGVVHTRTRVRDSMIVQSTENNWRRAFAGASPGFFSADSKQYIFLQGKTLYFIGLEEGKVDSVKEVESYKTSANKDWIAESINDMGATVVLQNLRTGTEKKFPNAKSFIFDRSRQWFCYEVVEDHSPAPKWICLYNLNTGKEKSFLFDSYLLDGKGQFLLIKETDPFINDNKKETRLKYINLRDSSVSTIWSSTDPTVKINSYSLDESGKQLLINLSQKGQNSIWYWKVGMSSVVLKISNQTGGIDPGLKIQGGSFTDNGKYIQFNLQPPAEVLQQMLDPVQVDVWSYMDTVLQSAQPELKKKPLVYKGIYNLEQDRIVFQESDSRKIKFPSGNFATLVKSGKDILGDRFWEKGYDRDSCWILSLKDGSTKFLPPAGQAASWSKDNYRVYFDTDSANYYSYNVITEKLINMTAAAKLRQLEFKNIYLRSKEKLPAGGVSLGWVDSTGFLVYDNFDIWQLDLEGKKAPVNITNGYGHSNKIVLQLSGYKGGLLPVFSNGDTLLLKAFNPENKFNGFYRKVIGKVGDPEKLYIGPYLFEGSFLGSYENAGMAPTKAALADRWIVLKQTASEAPNYFVTTDFKQYKRLTDFQPQMKYNWMTAEVHSFKQLDGTLSQGILYKPENFDAKKKYPVILSFYTQLTDQLYEFFPANYVDRPSIFDRPAWMVSHGYLVFIPDIYFTKGEWGPSTVNTMEGAAKYLKTLAFVDGKRLGVTSHSNSGRFGYYLLTHSQFFTAMSIGSGFTGTDVISLGLSINKKIETNNLLVAEREAYGAGGLGNLWENKTKWIDHTAVLQADKATSPLLLFHCKNDADDVRAAEELYIAFRRLEKPIWWLQYDEGNHVLNKLKDKRDFTIRYTQYFDHYLKGAPAPRWMKMGIPNKLKGVMSRYELDEN